MWMRCRNPGRILAEATVVAAVLIAPMLPAATVFADVRPNVLFILTEDQGAHLGYVGTPGLQTPHMDALARRGVYFREAFVAYPACSASKAAIYTGLHGHTNGQLNNTVNYFKPASELTPQERQNALYRENRIRSEYPTLVEILARAGYHTGVTYKLHVAPNEKFPPAYPNSSAVRRA